MATEYGFTPEQVGRMTWYQIRTMTAPEKSLGAGQFTVSDKEWREMRQKRKDREAKDGSKPG